MAIELLHPVTVAVAIACAPIATVAVSGAIDYLAHRHHERVLASQGHDSLARREEPGPQREMPASERIPASSSQS